MRRLFGPVRTSPRRLALVTAVALLLFARLAPYQPRYSAPTGGQLLIGFSPHGRQFALRNPDFPNLFVSQLHHETVFLHDLSAAGVGERRCEVNLFTIRASDESFPSWLFWESVRDPSLRRRLLAQVFGDA